MTTTTTSPLSHLSEVNNQGCDYLEHGDLTNAITYFRHALTHVKAYLHQTPASSHCSFSRNILPMPLEIVRNSGLANTVATNASSKNFIIHSHAIRMMNGYTFSNDALENAKVYTSIVVFNLAVTTHLQGLRRQSQRHLSQAKALYHHTHRLISSTVNNCYNGQATGNAVFDMLVLALYNNMALVHLEFSEYNEVGTVFQHLIRYAMSVSRAREEGGSDDISCKQYEQQIYHQINNFLLNATILGLNSPVAAAAA